MSIIRARLGASAKEIREQLATVSGHHLELHFTLPRAQWPAWAKAMTKSPPASLQSLVLRELEFDSTSAVGRPILSAKASAELWAALGDLESLQLVGHSFAADLAHPTLETISMEGFCLGKAFVKSSPDCPRLRKLTWAFGGDEHGVAVGVSHLKGLWMATGTPNLVDVDLSGADMDGDMCRAPSFMKSKLLEQLERVVLVNIEEDTLTKALPKLAHVRDICVSDRPELTSVDPCISNISVPSPTPLYLGATGRAYAFGLSDEHVPDSVEAMAQHRVTALQLLAHRIPKSAGIFGRALAAQADLESLDLSRPLTYGLNEGASDFFAALAGHASLKRLRLRGNRFPTATAELSALVRSLPSLEELTLSIDDVEDGMALELIEALGEAPKLRSLSLFGKTEAADMVQALPRLASSTIEELMLPPIKKWDAQAIDLVLEDLPQRLPSLRALDLSCAFRCNANRLRSLRAAFDARPLQRLELDLFESAEDIDALDELLAELPIEHLGLDLVRTEDPDRSGLAAALGRGRYLRRLGLDAKLSVAEVSKIFDALSQTPCEVLTDLRTKNDETSAHEEMAKRAAASRVRTFLRCDFDWIPALLRAGAATSIEVKGEYWLESRAPMLLEALETGEGLESLKLTDADILLPAVVGNPHLESIELAWCEPAKLYKLLVDLGKKGGPSKVRASGRYSDALAEELTAFAATKGIELRCES